MTLPMKMRPCKKIYSIGGRTVIRLGMSLNLVVKPGEDLKSGLALKKTFFII